MEKDISSINDDFKYQKVEWPVKRVFWVLMAVTIVYGLLGGFGDSNTLLNREVVKMSGAWVEYDKYLRVKKNFETKIHVIKSPSQNISISINNDYLEKVQIAQIIPEPERVELIDKRLIYHFAASNQGTITFFSDPYKMGAQNMDLMVNGEKARLEQFIYF